ncbi:unnamed protein product [Ixodes persulcatus]
MPSAGQEVVGEACAAWIFPSTSTAVCCILKSPAKIRNCGTYLIYHIRGLTGCNLAFCALPAETRAAPKLAGLRTLSRLIIRPSLRGGASWLTCSASAVPGMLYNVSWYKHPARYKRVLLKDLRELDHPTDALLVSSVILGTEVSCQITGYFRNFTSRSKRKSSSERYFVGIKAITLVTLVRVMRVTRVVTLTRITRVTLVRVTLVTLARRLRSVIITKAPQVGSGAEDGVSRLNLPLQETFAKDRLRINTYNNTFTISTPVKEREDAYRSLPGFAMNNQEYPVAAYFPTPEQSVRVLSLKSQRLHSFVSIVVALNANVKLEALANGTFLLFKDKRKNTQVQVQTQRCYQSEAQVCTCGLVAQQDNSVVKIDMCHSAHSLPTVVTFDMEGRKPTVNILRQHDGRLLIIRLSSGTFIQVVLEKWGMSFLLTVPAMNTSDVAGVCTLTEGGRRDLDTILDGYRYETVYILIPQTIKKSPLMIYYSCHYLLGIHIKPRDKGKNKTKKKGQFNDVSNKSRCVVFSPPPPPLFYFRLAWGFYKCDRSRASLLHYPCFSLYRVCFLARFCFKGAVQRYSIGMFFTSHELTGTLGVKDTRTKRHWPRNSFFRKSRFRIVAIRNCARSALCRNGVHKTSLIKGFAVADVTLIDDPQWASNTISLIGLKCEEEVSQGMNPNLVLADPFQVMQNLRCPGDCSYHGVCNGRECFCDEGYAGPDCSQPDGTTPEAIATDGLCDTRSSSCDDATVYGKHFLNLPTLVCEASRVEMNGSGVWIAVQRNVTVPARFMESTSVDCRLPDRSFLSESGVAGHTTWEIKVSNDKVHFSNSVRITVFDSSCELCSVADDRPNCTIQERRCLIDGECFVEAETHPSDFCLACVVGRSTQHWSPNPGKARRNRAPQLVDTAPEVTVFSGQSFRLNLVGADPDGTQSFFRLAMATANVSLSHDGQLSGQLYTSRNSSRQFDVVLFDECDRETNVRIEVTVLACPCLNGGTCETWSTAEAPVYDAVYCTCLRDFTGRRCEVLVNPCYSNPCFNGRCIAQSSGIFHCACPEDTTGSRCELPVDPCLPNPCAHGECVPDGQSMQCFCDPGFTGERCEIAANPCFPNPCQNGGQCQLTGPVYFRCHCDWGFTGLHCQNLIDPCTDRRCFTHVPCSAVGRTYTCGPCPPGYLGDGTVCEAIPVSSSQYHAGSALFEGGSDNTRGFSSNGSSAGFVQTIPSAEITSSYFSSSISSTGVQPPYMSPGFLGELTPSFIAGFPPFSSSLASGFSQVERFSLFFAGPAAYGTPIVSQGFFTHGAQGFVQGLPPPTDMAPIYMTGFTAFDTASSFVPAIAAPELSASYYIGVPFQVTPENLEPTDFSVEFPGTYFAWDMLAAETIYVSDGPQAEGRVISDGFTNPTTAESSTAHVEPTPTMVGFQTDAGSSFESTQFLSDAASNYIPSGLFDDVDDIPDSFLAESTMPSTTEYGLKDSGVDGSNEANQERFSESSADCILRDLLKGLVDSIPETATWMTLKMPTKCPPTLSAFLNATYLKKVRPLPWLLFRFSLLFIHSYPCPKFVYSELPRECDGVARYRPSKDTECLNGGVLTSVGSCKCSVGYTGDHCESAVCRPACKNGGLCLGKNKCKCTPGFSGKRCTKKMCAKDCKNGGTCVSHDKCSCAEGWEGGWCEEAKCEPPCVNGGSCLEPNKCVCPPGSSGGDCSVSSCSPPCLNGGRCARKGTCKCARGWTGKQCTKPTCSPPCQNGGKCVKPGKCSCKDGWTGRRCKNPMCVQDCANGGTCVKPNVCDCNPGFHGPQCDQGGKEEWTATKQGVVPPLPSNDWLPGYKYF